MGVVQYRPSNASGSEGQPSDLPGAITSPGLDVLLEVTPVGLHLPDAVQPRAPRQFTRSSPRSGQAGKASATDSPRSEIRVRSWGEAPMPAWWDSAPDSALWVRHLPPRTRAAVITLHAGPVVGHRPARPWQLAALRMRPVLRSSAAAVSLDETLLGHVRYRCRGWNDGDTEQDALRALSELGRLVGDVPVVLVGHAMGGRVPPCGSPPTPRFGAWSRWPRGCPSGSRSANWSAGASCWCRDTTAGLPASRSGAMRSGPVRPAPGPGWWSSGVVVRG